MADLRPQNAGPIEPLLMLSLVSALVCSSVQLFDAGPPPHPGLVTSRRINGDYRSSVWLFYDEEAFAASCVFVKR